MHRRTTGKTAGYERPTECSLRMEQLEQRQLLAADVLFDDPVAYSTGDEPSSIDVADFDGDGQLDIAIANTVADSISFLRGLPDGSFQRLWLDVTVRDRTLSVATGDLDQDGNADVVVSTEGSNRISLVYGKGNGEFQRPRTIRLSGTHESVALGDLNDDGRLDIVTTTSGVVAPDGANNLEPGVHAVLSTLDPLNLDGFETPKNIFSSETPKMVQVDDVNGDGHQDVLIAHEAFIFGLGEDDVTIVPGTGGLSFGSPQKVKTGGDPQAIHSTDLNGDSRADLIVVNKETIGVLMNQGNGSFATEVTYVVGPEPNAVTVADLDADGDSDVAVSVSESGSLSVLANQGDGSLVAQARFQLRTVATAVIAADFNGDQRADLALVRPESREVVALLNESHELPEAVNLNGNGSGYSQDFDSDLAANDGPGARLPIGWSAVMDDVVRSHVSQPFPSANAEGLFGMGLGGLPDRSLGVGVSSSEQNNQLTWTATVTESAANAFHMGFDIEAWSADPKVAEVLGEASFNVVLEADRGKGFETVHDFGQITTGRVLQSQTAPVGLELWKTDGTNVSLVADVLPGPESSNPRWYAVFQDALYFIAGADGVYKFDGQEWSLMESLGTCDFRCGVPGYVLNDALYYDILGRNHRDINDGQTAGTDMFLRIDDSGATKLRNHEQFDWLRATTVFQGDLFFVPEESWPFDYARELWRFDGQEMGLVEDINPRFERHDYPASSSSPRDFTQLDGELYFTAGPSDSSVREIFKTDGTGVTQVSGLLKGFTDFEDANCWPCDGVHDIAVINGELFARAKEPDTGTELWKLDDGELVQVADINPGSSDSIRFWNALEFGTNCISLPTMVGWDSNCGSQTEM